jgi:hypothetical protein
MLLALAQRFPVLAKNFDFEPIAFGSRNLDRVFITVRSDRRFETYRSVGGLNEVPKRMVLTI